MGRVTQVVNRNGEIVPFRRNRIVRAILAAVRASGSKDEWVADKLADMVVYFIDMQHGDRRDPPDAEEVDDMIEKALLSSPDLGVISQAFIAGRQQRREIRELEETISATPVTGPQVSQPDQRVGGWNRARIAAAVMRENGVEAAVASEVAQTVEEKVRELDLPRVTTGLIRELVDVELLSRGLIRDPGSVSVPRYDLEQWVFPGEETDLPPVAEQDELSNRASRRVLSQYALQSILPNEPREAHLDGRLHFEALHAPAAVSSCRLDVVSLLGTGAGFGLQRMFAESTAGIAAAFSRLATMVSATGKFTAGPVVLRGFDTAFSQQVQEDPDRIERSELQDGLRLLAAQAPGGLVIEVGPPGNASRDLIARTLIDTLAGADGDLRNSVRLEVFVSAGGFADPVRKTLIERSASAASFCGVPVFRLREGSRESSGGLFDEAAAGLPHDVVIAQAGINLARPAFEAASVDAYLETLDPLIELSVAGLAARARYLERVALRDMPEPIAASSRMFRALVGSSRDVVLVPVGLGFASAVLAKADSQNEPAAQRVAQQVMSYIGFKFRERASRETLSARLGARLEHSAAPRLAREDRAWLGGKNPESKWRLQLAQDEPYQCGAALDVSLPASGRIESESALHTLLGRDAEVATGRDETLTPVQVLELLRACTSEGGPKPAQLSITVQSRTCRDCGARYPASSEACLVCGSTAWAVPPGQRSLFEA